MVWGAEMRPTYSFGPYCLLILARWRPAFDASLSFSVRVFRAALLLAAGAAALHFSRLRAERRFSGCIRYAPYLRDSRIISCIYIYILGYECVVFIIYKY